MVSESGRKTKEAVTSKSDRIDSLKGHRRCRTSYRFRVRVVVLGLICLAFDRCASFQTPLTAIRANRLQATDWTVSNFATLKPSRCRQPTSHLRMIQDWEGDDIRWSSRLRRRLRQQNDGRSTPAKTTLIALNLFFFLYQTITTVNFIRRGHPDYWPRYAIPMITDAVVGSTIHGPLTLDFAFSNSLSKNQPHRFLTSGFLHGGIIHLLVNLDTLRRQPAWLETGLGIPLYITAFLISIVTGNIGHMKGAHDPFDRTLCLGASGGICGSYGLMYASLVRMGNSRAASQVLKGILVLLVMGLFVDNISTAAHVGGFLGGLLVGLLCGPAYQKNYSMRRKNSVEYDPSPRDFRQAMGFGVMPTARGLVPLPLLWGGLALLWATAKPKFRAIPGMMLKGFLFPGSLVS